MFDFVTEPARDPRSSKPGMLGNQSGGNVLLRLQCQAGNAAVARLLDARTHTHIESPGERKDDSEQAIVQRLKAGKLNVVGEDHEISGERRVDEREFAAFILGGRNIGERIRRSMRLN